MTHTNSSKTEKHVDFTHGSIIGKLIVFSVPIILSELLQNLYTSIDSLIVGNFVGANALAAVSVCGTLSRLVTAFFVGMSIGASVVVARAFGSGDRKELLLSMRISFSLSVLLGLLLFFLGVVFTPMLVRLCAVDENVFQEAVLYLRIYLGGVTFSAAYNIASGILRAYGDSRSPLLILLLTSCLNILLDILLVAVIPLGVAGVAIATITSQMASVSIACFRIRKAHPGFSLMRPKVLFRHRGIIAETLKIGMPSGLMGSLISLSNLFVWRYISAFGASAIAGIGVAHRLDLFVSLPAKACGMAVTTFVSQNEGAGNHSRAQKGGINALFLAFVSVAAIGLCVYIFADSLVSLFSSDPDIIEISRNMMRAILPFYMTIAVRDNVLGVLRGYGDARIPTFISLFGMIAVRQTYLVLTLPVYHNIRVVYYSYPIAWGSTALLLLIYYGCKKAAKKLP